MAISREARSSEYRSKSVRSGEALGARLFRPGSSAQLARNTCDTQASIRSALRRRRRTLGLTQEGAARVLGMPRLTYHRIETGARHIHFTELAKICALFNCHIGELVQDGQLATAFIHAAKAILGEAPE